jgi:molybdopterin-guanine dinucleotide biosynthesis protein B
LRGRPEWTLDALLERLAPVDLVLVEGFKTQAHPKLEVFRATLGKPLLHPDDENIVAIASDAPLNAGIPIVSLDDIEAVADILVEKAAPLDTVVARVRSA